MPAVPPSRRGQQNVHPDLTIDLSCKVAENAYDETTNPRGIVDIGSAENQLMLDHLSNWVKKNETAQDRKNYLKDNDGQNSPELPAAAASFLNRHFRPHAPLTPSNILVGNGLPAVLDALFFNLADAGAAVLVPTPGCGMFRHSLTARDGLDLVPVPCDDITEARFRQHVRPGRPEPEMVRRLRRAAEGRDVRAVLLANPENPLGRCYSSEMLRWLVSLCREMGWHLVVDEAYALSGGDAFNSVLTWPLADMLENVHVLYGMTEDFGLGGCRVGFLATYNQQLYKTMRTLSMFTWVSAFGGIISAKLLANQDYIANKYLPAFRKALNGRREYLASLLPAHEIPFTVPDAAFFVFLDLSRWLSSFDKGTAWERELALLEYLMGRGVFLEPGRAFFSEHPGFFRLNYGGEEKVFSLGMKRLIGALGELDGKEGKVDDAERTCAAERPQRSAQGRSYFCCFNASD